MTVFREIKINEHLSAIGEVIGTEVLDVMWLVKGTRRAALIDTGIGAGDLKGFIATLTDLPVVVLNTHADPDHVGGNAPFGTGYLNRRDAYLVPAAMDAPKRMFLVEGILKGNTAGLAEVKKQMTTGGTFVRREVEGGDVIELGGIALEAFSAPGHTPGSMLYWNRDDRELFAGDSLLETVWLFLDRCASVEAYAQALGRMRHTFPGDTAIYCGHSMQALPYTVIADLEACAEAIMAGVPSVERDFGYWGKCRECRNGGVGILFQNENVFMG